MQVIIINKDFIQPKDIKNDLHTFYNIIECNTIDIVERKIGGKYYDFIVDDEGLLKGRDLTLVCKNADEILVGNIIICKSNDEGETIGLTDKEISEISWYFIKNGLVYEV